MSALLQRLEQTRPALWVEVSPPRGANPEPLLRRLEVLKGRVDAINLTDNSLARVKMSGLVFGSLVRSRLGIPVVVNFSCRDRNRFALQSDLLGAAVLGIDAVVAVTGDKIPPADAGGVQTVRDLDALGLLRMIGALNRGDTGQGRAPLKTVPNLTAGAVANPNRKNIEREFELLVQKAQAGARFIVTQPVFESTVARAFLKRADALKLKTVLGILPVKRDSMAKYLKERVSDLKGASSHLDRFDGMDEASVRAKSLAENLSLMKALAREVAAFNIMSGGGPSLAIELALEFSKWRKDGDH
ncbi:MAG: methylenetetrahydrofolate reductase [Candidatus Binataceae bacterium]